jgi:hypothetical protein
MPTSDQVKAVIKIFFFFILQLVVMHRCTGHYLTTARAGFRGLPLLPSG